MSNKKINQWNAQRIAENVAEKAFDHLIVPHQAKLDALLDAAYWSALDAMGITKSISERLVKGGILGNETYCRFNLSGDDYVDAGQHYKGEDRFVSNNIIITDPDNVKAIELALETLNPLKAKRGHLRREVQSQITGKSVNTVVKNWPEIREMVEAVMGEISTSSGMVVPFEHLLARFLPALPAPVGA